MNSTRRNFFRSTGLALGAIIVAPAVFADGFSKPSDLEKADYMLMGMRFAECIVPTDTVYNLQGAYGPQGQTVSVHPGDILCKECGHKLYDAKRHLVYHFNKHSFEPDAYNVKHFVVHCGCIYCGREITLKERYAEWPREAWYAPIDVQVFDDQAEKFDLVPPTVSARFEARLDKVKDIQALGRDEANAMFDEEWAAWRRERVETSNPLVKAWDKWKQEQAVKRLAGVTNG